MPKNANKCPLTAFSFRLDNFIIPTKKKQHTQFLRKITAIFLQVHETCFNFAENIKKHTKMENNTQMLPISLLEVNKGQIDGLPKNPRFIRDERFAALVKSIKDAPEMLHLRELLVVKHGKKYVTIGGNMRLRACQELGYEEVPCKVLAEDTPTAKLREYAIKDNNGFGQDDWDILANEWDAGELQDWGVELPIDVENGGEPASPDDDVQDDGYCCKITFDNQYMLDEFMQRYEALIAEEFSCTISVA